MFLYTSFLREREKKVLKSYKQKIDEKFVKNDCLGTIIFGGTYNAIRSANNTIDEKQYHLAYRILIPCFLI